MIRKLVGADNPKLVTKVEYSGDIKKALKIGNELLKFSRKNPLLGISANQLGVMERVCIATIDGEIRVFINPVIVEKKGRVLSRKEGCLSFPGVRGDIWRTKEITISYEQYYKLDKVSNNITEIFTGMNAIVIHHEIDHLDGIRCIDKMMNKTVEK